MYRACSTHVEKVNICRILVGMSKGKRPLARHRCSWEDNIKINFRRIGWGGMDWIDLIQDRNQWRAIVNTVMNLQVSSNLGKFLRN
jgi:hypothetical protein